MHASVVVVGGGLAGLHVARLLHRSGIDFRILEARDRWGGRILTVDERGVPSNDGFDLGPSWFWPDMQPEMRDIARELNLPVFAQNTEGDVIIHRMSRESPQRYRGAGQTAQSMRFVGGTSALASAIAAALPDANCRLNARVTRLDLLADKVQFTFRDGEGAEATATADHVILALPPRLLEETVSFSPALDPQTARRWRETPTWMAPHAKFFALYDRAFWREAGLSGTAQSMAGPLAEIHDATTASGKPALFGFVGIASAGRRSIGREPLVTACLRQLATLFGPEAAKPVATLFKDWADDRLTSAEGDRDGGDHPTTTDQPWVSGEWLDRISLAGSETSPTEPGYLAGAITAAERAVGRVIAAKR